MKIFCLIPAYNEKGNIKILTSRLDRVLSKLSPEYKIFYVIQGNDGSIELLTKLKRKNRHLDWIYFERPLGIGRAYKIGFSKINNHFSHVLTLDADLNHDPRAIPEFIKEMKKNNTDMVIGSRFIKGGIFDDRRYWKRITSFITNRIITFLVKIKLHDISSGFRFLKREVIEKVGPELSENGYPNYMEMVIKTAKSGYKLSEVPIVYYPRIWGKSKMGKLRTMYDYCGFLGRLIINL